MSKKVVVREREMLGIVEVRDCAVVLEVRVGQMRESGQEEEGERAARAGRQAGRVAAGQLERALAWVHGASP